MLKIEPTIISEGFDDGSGYGQGEYLFSSGMNKSQNGITPNWAVNAVVDNTTLTDLTSPLQWITQAAPGGTSGTFGVDSSGNIYKWNGSAWSLAYKPSSPSSTAFSGNGLLGGQDGNLYYKGDRFLGQYNGTADYTTGSITVTNGSNAVVGSGTTFTSGMVGRQIVISGIWYTIGTFTDATHITLTANYTGLSGTASFAVKVGWNDQFQDFGTSVPVGGTFCPMDIYEDTILISHNNLIGTYNVQTNSFSSNAFNLPSNYIIRALKSGRNGILIGGNFGNRSFRLLWNNQSTRSISPWIWSNENVLAIEPWNGNWIITTNRRILVSTGYTESELVPIPGATANGTYINCFPQGTAVVNNFLFIASSTGSTNRIRSGIKILNLTNLKWEYSPTANGVMINNRPGAIFFDSAFTIHFSWQTSNPSKTYIGNLSNSSPTSAFVISAPVGQGNGQKVAEGVRLSLGLNPMGTDSRNFSVNVAVKAASTKRILWGFGQTSAPGSDTSHITVNGSLIGLNDAQIGDEVTIMEGVNAGQTAHITSIANQGLSNETWTLDTALTSNIESGILVQVAPFKLMSKQTITNAAQLKDLLFTAKGRVESRKFWLKIVIDGITNMQPEIHNTVDFIYDDLGDL